MERRDAPQSAVEMKVNLPNQITIGRLGLAIVFIAVLAQFSAAERPPRYWLLDVSAVLFIIASLSDIADGYLARKHNQVTSFGRVIDPFVDKVLVCGAFILFVGAGFVKDGANVTDVAPWMAVLILCRELFVTGIRGFSEAKGESFAATVYGKAKMVLQSVTAAWILFTVAHPEGLLGQPFFVNGRKVLVWATVIGTALSMIAYLGMARTILAETSRPAEKA